MVQLNTRFFRVKKKSPKFNYVRHLCFFSVTQSEEYNEGEGQEDNKQTKVKKEKKKKKRKLESRKNK